MQAWFFAADTLAEQLTELFNRMRRAKSQRRSCRS